MNTREAIKAGIDLGKMIADSYIGDLTDEEMMVRPHPNCNHIKWQIGHLIASENNMIENSIPGSMPALPDGFAEKYTKETSTSDDPQAFHSKSELLELYETQRKATLAALEKASDSDLDQPTPEAMQAYAPTVGSAFNMQGAHWTMHAGQWAVIRRKLGRDPLY